MDAREYIRELDRMLRTVGEPEKYSKVECYRADCYGCPFYNDNDDTETSFYDCLAKYEEAVDIVEKWVEANPHKTIQSVFLENYPNAPITHGRPGLCVNVLGYGVDCECMDSCKSCWQTSIEELEEKK